MPAHRYGQRGLIDSNRRREEGDQRRAVAVPSQSSVDTVSIRRATTPSPTQQRTRKGINPNGPVAAGVSLSIKCDRCHKRTLSCVSTEGDACASCKSSKRSCSFAPGRGKKGSLASVRPSRTAWTPTRSTARPHRDTPAPNRGRSASAEDEEIVRSTRSRKRARFAFDTPPPRHSISLRMHSVEIQARPSRSHARIEPPARIDAMATPIIPTTISMHMTPRTNQGHARHAGSLLREGRPFGPASLQFQPPLQRPPPPRASGMPYPDPDQMHSGSHTRNMHARSQTDRPLSPSLPADGHDTQDAGPALGAAGGVEPSNDLRDHLNRLAVGVNMSMQEIARGREDIARGHAALARSLTDFIASVNARLDNNQVSVAPERTPGGPRSAHPQPPVSTAAAAPSTNGRRRTFGTPDDNPVAGPSIFSGAMDH